MVGSAALSMVDESMVANAPRGDDGGLHPQNRRDGIDGASMVCFLYLRISIDIHGMTFRCDALKIYH